MSKNLTSPCCNSTYELDTLSFCCGAEIAEVGLCYSCKEHAEPEGYVCDECEGYFDTPQDKIHSCGFCGEDLIDDISYCSGDCSVADNSERV